LAAEVVGKVGVDTAGTIDISTYPKDEDVDFSTSLGFEFLHPISNKTTIGTGLEYQFKRQDATDHEFHFIPIYGLIRLKLSDARDMDLYLTGKAGCNFFKYEDLDCRGGLYYGIGAGVIFDKEFELELLYSVSKGKIRDWDADVTASKVGLTFGYRF
jgi:hypothetical protein